eukprot:1681465-Prymnesium_polylepis.1
MMGRADGYILTGSACYGSEQPEKVLFVHHWTRPWTHSGACGAARSTHAQHRARKIARFHDR